MSATNIKKAYKGEAEEKIKEQKKMLKFNLVLLVAYATALFAETIIPILGLRESSRMPIVMFLLLSIVVMILMRMRHYSNIRKYQSDVEKDQSIST